MPGRKFEPLKLSSSLSVEFKAFRVQWIQGSARPRVWTSFRVLNAGLKGLPFSAKVLGKEHRVRGLALGQAPSPACRPLSPSLPSSLNH